MLPGWELLVAACPFNPHDGRNQGEPSDSFGQPGSSKADWDEPAAKYETLRMIGSQWKSAFAP